MAGTKGKGAAAARAAGAVTRPPSNTSFTSLALCHGVTFTASGMPQSPIRGPGGYLSGASAEDYDSGDEDADLAAVLALSLQEAQQQSSPPSTSKPVATGAPAKPPAAKN
jgi:hypothetical protein